MAAPVALAAVGGGISLAGGVASAMGARYAADAKANMYEYQAGVAKLNEQIEKQNADYARKSGEVSASIVGAKAKQQMGLIKAGQGASGLDVNSGSNVQVQESQQNTASFDQATTRSNAARQAYGYETGAVTQQANQGLSRMGAEAARTSGDLNVASSIIGSVGSVASKWMAGSSSFGLGEKTSNFLIPGNWGEQS